MQDEEQPLLHEVHGADPIVDPRDAAIAFDPTGDPDDPQQWPLAFRWGIVSLLACMAFTVTFTCISVVPVAGPIIADLSPSHTASKSASVLLVTIWELGEAAGPLLIAPLSEVCGRYPVFNAANLLFIVGVLLTAISQTTGLLIFARFMTGCAVASNVLNPSIIGDIFPPEKRGSAVSLVMLAPLIGGAAGPAIAGAIAQSSGWRQIMYMSLALAIFCEILFLTFFRETYKVAILKRRAARLKLDTDDESLKRVFSASAKQSEGAVWTAITRPAKVLWSSFVLQILSVYGSVVFSLFYVMSTTLPEIMREKYHLKPAIVGSSLISFSIGSLLGVVTCDMLIDRIYKRLQRRSGEEKAQPENKLPLVIVGAFTLPATVALYGWIAQLHLSPWLLLVSVILMGFCMITSMVPTMAYVVDAFGLYSASATTSVLITRCLMGTFLPLATAPLTDKLGYGMGFVVIAGLCLVLAPIPVLILKHGRRWRQTSEYTEDETRSG